VDTVFLIRTVSPVSVIYQPTVSMKRISARYRLCILQFILSNSSKLAILLPLLLLMLLLLLLLMLLLLIIMMMMMMITMSC